MYELANNNRSPPREQRKNEGMKPEKLPWFVLALQHNLWVISAGFRVLASDFSTFFAPKSVCLILQNAEGGILIGAKSPTLK
jgi:hypothetical protein